MKKTVIILSLLSYLTFNSCSTLQWSEKKRIQFGETCQATDKISDLCVYFKGFTNTEIAQVNVKQIHNGIAVDTFYITPQYYFGDMHAACIEKEIYLFDDYHFIVSQDTFVLSDMEMVAMRSFGSEREKWSCDLRRYSINGKLFRLANAPIFEKKGYDNSSLLEEAYRTVRDYELSKPAEEVAEWAIENKGFFSETAVNQNSLEDMIIKTIKAYFNKDEKTLNSFIHKDFGISFLYSRGAADNVSTADKISFDDPVPEYLPYDISFEPNYTLHFEKLPCFSCNNEKWNKPSGIYCDTVNTDKTLSRVAKFEKEDLLADWTDRDIKKFEEIENKSHKIIVLGKEFGEFIFYLMLIEGKWYLAAIDRFEACSA